MQVYILVHLTICISQSYFVLNFCLCQRIYTVKVCDFPIDTKVIMISIEMSVTYYFSTNHNIINCNDAF